MSTERKQIAFVTNPTAKSPLAAPAASGEKKSYENHTFKPEYSDLKLKFEQALTWLRFIPSIRGSAQCWLMPVDVFASDNNDTNQFPTFVDPKSVDPNAVSVFEQARMWFYKNEKEVLRKKDENPRGFKLHPRKRCIAWAMVNGAESGKTLRIFEASLYDGKFGGATGLGHSLFSLATARDNEPGSETVGQPIYGEISDPEKGRLVCIEKTAPATKDAYASYKVKMGKSESPMKDIYNQLTDEEVDKLVPIEQVLHVPTEEEQKEYLKRYIGEERFSKIFGSKPE